MSRRGRPYVTFTCLECDHEHEVPVQQDDAGDDYAEAPEYCEGCGAPTDDGGMSEQTARRIERQQMGITS